MCAGIGAKDNIFIVCLYFSTIEATLLGALLTELLQMVLQKVPPEVAAAANELKMNHSFFSKDTAEMNAK